MTRTLSEEHRRNISESMRGRKKPPRTEEHRRKLSEARKGKKIGPYSEKHRQAISEALTGRVRPGVGQKIGDTQRGVPKKKCVADCACGKHKSGWAAKTKYILLFGQHDHPISSVGGWLYEHRKVLYDVIGPGPHPCHWCEVSLEWGGLGGIIVDHVNRNKRDNRVENLVPSCHTCNITRVDDVVLQKVE